MTEPDVGSQEHGTLETAPDEHEVHDTYALQVDVTSAGRCRDCR